MKELGDKTEDEQHQLNQSEVNDRGLRKIMLVEQKPLDVAVGRKEPLETGEKGVSWRCSLGWQT